MSGAFIVMDGVRYFSRIFFVEGGDKDFMGALWKNPGATERWHLDYRFRYYVTEAVTWGDGPNDRRSEYSFSIDAGTPKQAVLKTVRGMLNVIVAPWFQSDNKLAGSIHELVLETSDVREIRRMMSREKWAHFKDTPR